MCRFVFYQGPELRLAELLTEPDHSLINQSFDSRERSEPLNGDGFGVGWYVPELSATPALFRAVTPAWSNANLAELARVVASDTILAHVRAATVGGVSEANCHPFRRERLMFMHNGDIGGFDHMRRGLLSRLSDAAFENIRGNTDSEHFFALVHDAIDDPEAVQTPEALLAALRGAIDSTRELLATFAPHESFYLNALLTDGRSAVAVRYADDDRHVGHSLYVNEGESYRCEDGVCRMRAPGERGGTVLVASEPLSTDDGWQLIESNTALLITEGEVIGRATLD
ncbi:MAG TPA: class II glutamine amidotransferase [Pseudomonadales bacterium]|nr:class II glutamine amidotransferase [Pseudomonadales bacterium]